MGNGEGKKFICTTHGHELRGEGMWEKVKGIRIINGRYKIDRGRLRIL